MIVGKINFQPHLFLIEIRTLQIPKLDSLIVVKKRHLFHFSVKKFFNYNHNDMSKAKI